MEHPYVKVRSFIGSSWDDEIMLRKDGKELLRCVTNELEAETPCWHNKAPAIFELKGQERFVHGMTVVMHEDFEYYGEVFKAGHEFIVKSLAGSCIDVQDSKSEQCFMWHHERFNLAGESC